MSAAALVAMALVQLAVLACDPFGFVVAAPLVLVALIVAAWFVIAVFGSLGEMYALARDRRTRVLHGLEHACAAMLERAGRVVRSGQTHDGFFELEVVNDGRISDDTVRRAAEEAITRVARGEVSLAFHTRCGTSLAVSGLVVSSLVIIAAIIGWAAGITPRILVAGTVAAVLLAWRGSRPLGLLAQRALTVSTGFAVAVVGHTRRVVHASGDTATVIVEVDVYLVPPIGLSARRLRLASSSSTLGYIRNPAEAFSECPREADVEDWPTEKSGLQR